MVIAGVLSLTAFACLSISCNSKKTEIRKELGEFTKATVTIPDNMDCIDGLNVKEYKDTTKKAKLVIYYDTLSCQNCSISHLSQMEPLFERSRKSGAFDVLIIFSPRPEECANVTTEIATLEFDFPVFVDTYGEFRNNNKCIPTDDRFHSFLLDKEGHPIFVGNPLDSKQLETLFTNIVNKL